MLRLFTCLRLWYIAAAAAFAGYAVGRVSSNLRPVLTEHDKKELDLLRDHVHQEGLTKAWDGNEVTLQRLDDRGQRHPVRVNKLKDGRVQIDIVDRSSEHASYRRTCPDNSMSHADMIMLEKTGPATTHTIVK